MQPSSGRASPSSSLLAQQENSHERDIHRSHVLGTFVHSRYIAVSVTTYSNFCHLTRLLYCILSIRTLVSAIFGRVARLLLAVVVRPGFPIHVLVPGLCDSIVLVRSSWTVRHRYNQSRLWYGYQVIKPNHE